MTFMDGSARLFAAATCPLSEVKETSVLLDDPPGSIPFGYPRTNSWTHITSRTEPFGE